MCLIFVAVEAHPKYRIVIAANRDEFYDRPSAPASFWPEAPQLLAGRDLKAGGTWLGITRTGRMAALTNYRDPNSNRTEAPSRGNLVSNYLLGSQDVVSYLEEISASGLQYNGFNLLAGGNGDFYYFSNCGKGIRKLGPGIHGLSNHLLDTPWPKVEKGKKAIASILADQDIPTKALFDLLSDHTAAADEDLPDTGVGLELERMLSPVFIRSAGYGTRCSTVILLDREGSVVFTERSFANGSEKPSTVEYSLCLQP